MKVRFLREWRGIRRDTVRDWPDGAANLLISRGICAEVKPKQTRKRNGSKSRNSKRV